MEDRSPMDDVMTVILPLLLQRFMQLFTHNDSDQSALIQKQILKIFHAYTQVCVFVLLKKISNIYKFRLASFKFSSIIYTNNGSMA